LWRGGKGSVRRVKNFLEKKRTGTHSRPDFFGKKKKKGGGGRLSPPVGEGTKPKKKIECNWPVGRERRGKGGKSIQYRPPRSAPRKRGADLTPDFRPLNSNRGKKRTKRGEWEPPTLTHCRHNQKKGTGQVTPNPPKAPREKRRKKGEKRRSPASFRSELEEKKGKKAERPSGRTPKIITASAKKRGGGTRFKVRRQCYVQKKRGEKRGNA